MDGRGNFLRQFFDCRLRREKPGKSPASIVMGETFVTFKSSAGETAACLDKTRTPGTARHRNLTPAAWRIEVLWHTEKIAPGQCPAVIANPTYTGDPRTAPLQTFES
jgi:hypothetical protein